MESKTLLSEPYGSMATVWQWIVQTEPSCSMVQWTGNLPVAGSTPGALVDLTGIVSSVHVR